MKIYYYIFSDNEEGWFVGEASNSLKQIIDKVEQLSFPWKIKTARINIEESIDVSKQEIEETKQLYQTMTKIFQ